jgi:SAM-dependent methyltransferase
VTTPDDAARKQQHASSFGAVADLYDAARPSYPPALVDAVLEGDPARIVDLGAGTGKLTRLLAARGRDVVAVDPSAEMLARLASRSPEIETHVGSAESLPLPDDSADLIVCAQAWHWVEPVAASAEVGRVLKPGGVLALVWNARDIRIPWVAELGEIMGSGGENSYSLGGVPEVAAPFAEPAPFSTAWVQPMTRARLHDLVLSRSYVIVRPEDERRQALADVDALLDAHSETAGDEFGLPYVTEAYLYRRP